MTTEPRETTFLRVNIAKAQEYLATLPLTFEELDILRELVKCSSRSRVEETAFYLDLVVMKDAGMFGKDADPWEQYCVYREVWKEKGFLFEEVPSFYAIGYGPNGGRR